MFSFTKSLLSRIIRGILQGKTLFFIFIACFLSSFLYSTIINVPTPYATIQAGIDAAANSDTVLVQPGTYVENINFNGKLITLGSLFLTTQDTTYISSTYIDGNSSGRVVIFYNGEDSTAVLCGFTISNGLVSGGYPEGCGAGIYCNNNSSPSLQNVTITGNSADYGGGIHCDIYSSPSLQNVTITGNSVTYQGAGIYCNNNSSPSLENVTISGNSADSLFYSGRGGGIYCSWYSSPSLQNVTITGNSASYSGGGIHCDIYSSPSLQNVTISGNSTTYYGGGIYCYNSSPSLENVTMSDNSADYGGGIYCDNYASPNLINSILWNDSTEEIYFNFMELPNSITISYSDIQGGEAGIITNYNGTVYWLEGNIDEDPLFVDPGIGDYHLQPSSPCIDAGDPASPIDPDGTITDMGAYYFHQFMLPPEADFTADTTNGYLPLTVNFTDLSTPGSGVIDEWYWEFGDGNNSSLQNPSNEYYYPEIYTVSLTVTDVNDSTDTETKVDYITVNPPAYIGPVWHISTTGSDVWGNGSTQYPFATIQHGINTSSNTDTVLVQPGTYVENINYNGKLITVGSLFLTTQDTTYISSTIIDGNSSGSVVTFTTNENSSAVLCGFTITNGYSGFSGGGILCEYSSPSLKNVTISGNGALNYGGGISCSGLSSPSLNNVTISGNTTTGSGGGIRCNNSSPSLQNVTISGNYGADNGGGIYCWNNSSPSLQNVIISGNSASNSGGGILCCGSNLSLINSILWNDSPEEIYIVSGGSVTATYSDIEGGWVGTGNIDEDPLFVDPGIGDYHLQPSSPCIDAGDPASPLDPDNTIADMGAYYFHQYINANFIADTTNGYVPLTVNFTDLSTSNSGVIDEWYWDFGDGNNSSLQDPANEYLLPGNYTVLLTVTNVNDSTDTETKVDYITVNPPAYIGPVWHISTTGSDVWGNGSTQYPFATIQYGINVSSNTDTVLVQPDTYFENIDYNGKNITVASLFLTTQDTAYISTTIIDGNSSGSVVTFNNGEDLTVILCGFTITNGSATCGGGIYCSSSSPSLQNVTISGNSASYGGGIYCQNNSSPSLENVTITGNASDSGGGINCQNNSSPSLQNVTISGNSASIWGGGIYCSMSNPILINSILWNDSPEEIYINSGSLTATYSDIQGGFTGTDNIDSDPLFVNPGIGDYHLQSISPCIDAGDPASPLDPDCTIADMGAYYFHQQYNGPVWHISTTGSDLTGTGCEQNPFATIQHGINVASNTDTVLVHIGTYVENINYNGKNITVGSLFLTTQDTTYISSTTIDGNSIGRVVIFNSGEDSTAVLCGFTITNGSAGFGGGIFCGESNPSLKNVTISGNSASGDFGYGAGICCWENSSPSLENVTISGNSANYGGGICCWYSSPILQNVTISGNSASGTFGYGGGIYFYESSLSFENITITGNSANYGGGIYCYFSSPSLENVTITSNNVIYDGGGIYCYWYSSPSLQNVTITGNSAVDYGGGIYCYNDTSNPSLINSILWNDSPQEIYINSSSVTATYSDIQGGFTGTGNIDSDPLFADPGNGDCHLTWANFPIPDSTMSPCIDTGDPSSPFDPDGTIADMGAYYFDKSPGAPVITAVTDIPDDHGRYVQVIWNRSPYDAPNSPVIIESYSVWRYDNIFGDRGIFEIYEDFREIFEKAAKDNNKNYYWQRDDEILTFITQLPAVGYAQYSVVSPTLLDSSVVSINYSVFKVLAHTDVTLIYYPSIPDSGYSIDNIAPDETRVYIAQNGSNIGLCWDEVEYGTFQGNSYLELNGIWYKIYAGDSPDFVCDEAHLIDTVTDLHYDYPLTGEDKKFFKIVVSDQPEAGRSINWLAKPEEPAGDYRKARKMFLE